jgi:hypothetical protein
VIQPCASYRRRGLRVTPVTLRRARAFIAACCPGLRPVQGHRFSIGVATTGPDPRLVGVVMVGRPAARRLDDGYTAEATLACRHGTRCVCPTLLVAAWRTARAMGYRPLVNRHRADEPATGQPSAGWFQITGPREIRRGGGCLRALRGARITRRLWQTPVPDLEDGAS